MTNAAAKKAFRCNVYDTFTYENNAYLILLPKDKWMDLLTTYFVYILHEEENSAPKNL